MLLIVAHHFAVHGNFHFAFNSITLNELWIQLLASGGKIGVNVFVLISGYFLCQAKEFSLNKVLRLWLSVFFYSLLFFALFATSNGLYASPKQVVLNFFPITFQRYWFISTYFTLYLLYPFINILLHHLTRRQYKNLLMLLTFLWCVIPTFLISKFQSNFLWWFVYLYLIAGYIRTYTQIVQPRKYIIFALVIYLLTFLSVIGFDMVGMKIPFCAKHATFFFAMQKIPTLLISILLFISFKNIKIQQNDAINMLAACTLGVYLIHDNIFVRPFLWQNVFKNATYAHSPWLVPYSIGVILLVFLSAALVELIRKRCLEAVYKQKLASLATYLENLTQKLLASKRFNYF